VVNALVQQTIRDPHNLHAPISIYGTSVASSHQFAAAGHYAVRFTVTDGQGVTIVATTAVHLVPANSPLRPRAALAAPDTAYEGDTVRLDASGSSDPSGEALHYTFDEYEPGGYAPLAGFGSTSAGALHGGVNRFRLVVANALDLADTTSRATYGRNRSPIVTAGADTTVRQGRKLLLQGSFTDPGMASERYRLHIDWGDGSDSSVYAVLKLPGVTVAGTRSTLPTYTHIYTAPGVYALSLTVYDFWGEFLPGTNGLASEGSGADTLVVTILPNAPPVANANGPYAGVEGGAITFSSAGTADADGDTLKYAWSFGDGSASAAANPVKRYADNGSYTVTLKVTDPSGATATSSTTTVVDNVAPTLKITAPYTVLEGSTYVITASGSDVGTIDRNSLEYALDCGQGAGYSAWSQTVKSVACPALPDQLAAPLPVRVAVRDRDGAVTEAARALAVKNAAPVPEFGATSATTIPAGGTVAVAGSFSDAGAADAPWKYTVYWGDGATTKGTTDAQRGAIAASHTYTSAGSYLAYLKVTDKDVKSGSSPTIPITVAAP
jgi:PKD repeat protein